MCATNIRSFHKKADAMLNICFGVVELLGVQAQRPPNNHRGHACKKKLRGDKP